jgi:hypothetical protein
VTKRKWTDPPASWKAAKIEDVVCAYRKAKADAFFEHTQTAAEDFATFEADDLITTLRSFHQQLVGLKTSQVSQFVLGLLDLDPSRVELVPKKLKANPPEKADGHMYFSDAERASRHQLSGGGTLSFRTHMPLSVKFRIMSALWINWVGHRYDAQLDRSAYGSRVRRLAGHVLDGGDRTVGQYHLHAPGSFEPYFYPYKRWRDAGLNRVRSALKEDEAVIVLTLDLKSYYHNIDPTFIHKHPYTDVIKSDLSEGQAVATSLGKALCSSYQAITTVANAAIGNNAPDNGSNMLGVPLGDAAARIMANVLLGPWDRRVQETLTPLFYGRYVDDMFLVMKDGTIHSGEQSTFDIIEHVAAKLNDDQRKYIVGGEDSSGDWKVQIEHAGKSKLLFQSSKSRCFMLQGQAGLDMLDAVESEIRDLSSERRLLPDPDFLEDSTSARVLSAAGTPSVEPDSFGRAEGLSVKRLGWSVQMKNAETLAHDLPPSEWRSQRQQLYRFAENHIFSPLAVMNQFHSLSRVLGLAVSLGDWGAARRLADHVDGSLGRLFSATTAALKFEINGVEPPDPHSEKYRHRLRRAMRRVCRDAVVRSWPWSDNDIMHPKDNDAKDVEGLLDWCNDEDNGGIPQEAIRSVMETDCARDPYRTWHNTTRFRGREPSEKELWEEPQVRSQFIVGDASTTSRAEKLVEFLQATADNSKRVNKGSEESLLPFAFATRPYRPDELPLLAEACAVPKGKKGDRPLHVLAGYTYALRGTWVLPHALEPHEHPGDHCPIIRIELGNRPRSKVKVAVANWQVSDAQWAKSAAEVPDHSRARYRRFAVLINAVLKLEAEERPDYLVLPELAVPKKWIESASSRLLAHGISLIAGVEYQSRKDGEVVNAVRLVLTDGRLGYSSAVQLEHHKSQPSLDEGKELREKHGRQFVADEKHARRVYDHDSFAFGLLICSELQNLDHVNALRGAVDAIIVPSWNKDLKTYAPLVEATSFAVHSYIVYVNNGAYGDCRVRAPFKVDYSQDVCRIKGGENCYVAIAEVDIEALRRFQTRHISGDGKFKPVPDGYKIAEFRELKPAE